MELREAIYNRRSIRKYKPDKIDENIILEIIKDAMNAPSGHNGQPWKFKLLDDDTKNKLADVLYEKYKDKKGYTASFTADIIKSVPHLVVVYLDSEDNSNMGRSVNLLSIGSIIDEILLLAEERNIGTLWIADTNLIMEDIKEITGVNLESISCIGFGYKDQFPHKRPRKNFEDIIIK